MSKQEKFYDWLSTGEPPPINRRVYEAAKLPFAYLAQFLWWVSSPWRRALPLALAGVALLCGFLILMGYETITWGDFGTVATVATVVVGVVVVILDVLRAIFE